VTFFLLFPDLARLWGVLRHFPASDLSHQIVED
jgi:hypothetical protein